MLFRSVSQSRYWWIAKQEQVTIGQLADFDFVDLPAVDQYRHMIKAQPKQKLDTSIQTEYPALQTIVYHSKKINAIFGPLLASLLGNYWTVLIQADFCFLQERHRRRLKISLEISTVTCRWISWSWIYMMAF